MGDHLGGAHGRCHGVGHGLLQIDTVGHHHRPVLTDHLHSGQTRQAERPSGLARPVVPDHIPVAAVSDHAPRFQRPGHRRGGTARPVLECHHATGVDSPDQRRQHRLGVGAASHRGLDTVERIVGQVDAAYAAKIELVGAENFHQFERNVMLQSLDTHWREHLAALDHLRQGIHLRGYAQKNPKQEYKREAFELFENLLDAVRNDVTRLLVTVQIRSPEDVEETAPHAEVQNVQYHHADYDEALGTGDAAEAKALPPAQAAPKVGRNDACPCGSGKKYKHCHGKLS